MAAVKHSNFFSTTLATPPAGTGDLPFNVTSATNLPTLAAGDWCYVVLKNASLTREVIKIGTIVGVTLTPASGGRGADGSAAYAGWLAGDIVELCFVNASLLDLLYGFKEAFYNTAKTFKSIFANTNTAARTYTFQDRDGNVITDADIVAASAVTPADADVMPVMVGGVLKKVTWSNIKATISALIPAGTRMPFAQATAPTGWTQDVTDNADNRMLRVITTAGGGVAGSHSPILNNVVAAHTHGGTTNTENAYHSHTDSGHTHTTAFNQVSVGGYEPAANVVAGNTVYRGTTTGTANLGNETALHAHDFSTSVQPGAANWTPRYIDMIICAKN